MTEAVLAASLMIGVSAGVGYLIGVERGTRRTFEAFARAGVGEPHVDPMVGPDPEELLAPLRTSVPTSDRVNASNLTEEMDKDAARAVDNRHMKRWNDSDAFAG